jgi:hypothetical protein
MYVSINKQLLTPKTASAFYIGFAKEGLEDVFSI